MQPASKEPEPGEAQATFGQVLRNRDFFALWLAQLVSGFGDWLAVLALFSLVAFRWKGNANEVSGILFAFVLPFALVGPVAGVFVDRWNLKRTMIASDLLRAVLALLLMVATSPLVVYALIFALSAVSCFFLPAQIAAIPLLVQKRELLVANALNSQTQQLNKVIGPAVAGILVAGVGERVCFLLDAASFVISAALLLRITVQREAGAGHGTVAAVLRDVREGLHFLWHHAAIRFVLLATVAAMLAIGAFDALIAVYVRDVLAAGSRTFGALISMVAVGAIVGATAVGKYGQRWSRVRLVTLGIFALGAGVAVLAMVSHSLPALGASLFMGVAAGCVMVPSQALMQEETPQALLGRVSSSSFALITLSQLLAVAVAGRIAAWVGIRGLYHGVALVLALTGAIGYVYARSLRTVDSLPDTQAEE